MILLEKQVVRLEFCEILQELRVKWKNLFRWKKRDARDPYKIYFVDNTALPYADSFAAFTGEELDHRPAGPLSDGVL